MEVCIIGLPKSGKTTIFNVLTRGKADTTTYATTTLAPNIGISKVPEPRLQVLDRIFHPKKVTPAEVKYVDIVGIAKDFGKGEGVSGQFLNYLSNADALIHVVRAFEDENVPHIDGTINPKRDVATMNLELVFSDLAIIERRLKRLEDSLKGAKQSERDPLLKEQSLLQRIKSELEKEVPIWQQSLTAEEIKNLANYQFLTAKPMLLVINIGESQLTLDRSFEAEIRSTYAHTQFEVVTLCGKLEMELTQLDDADGAEFRKALGLTEPAVDRVIRLSYRLLGLISFFTTVSDELKAWTITTGMSAVKAAGKIHSDIEKGFIRAEVVNFNDLDKCGSLAEARKHGLLRLEGKNYLVQDGDIITFLFNI
ncbi:MAG: redox-regulated ATPase YchF [Chloroflexi bacterium RBG_13_48_17]|nr:MAG: redox-regulated ATPase YchF [Chloroflexi bacterium RBG_13_48_17]